jgi:NAD(P)-dependent dehydrogenase (short-subunit alcohol dehydrogenase family)
LSFITLSGFAQTYSGGIRGSVTDPGGSVIAGAAVTLTDEATQQVRSATTDSSGSYAFNALQPSTYTLHITATGFAAADRTHIVLATQDFLTIDVPLTVGSATNVVQVSAEAVLVDNSTASISANLDQRRLEDVPVLGRNPYITAGLSGVFVNTGNPQFIRFADQNGTTATSVAGGPVAANLYTIDGVPITDTNNRPIAIPTIESIQDVKVQALTYDAQVGRTGGGVFNTLLRSGANTVHGSVFGETRQTAWLANDFFANRSGIPRPDSPYYNWGASLGGPVTIPHLYDGRDKTFFWIGSEGYIQTSPYTETFVVPTDVERSGDFSHDFNADGSLHTIYNPNDTYTDATGVHRRPFAGNTLTNINTVGKNIASYFPSPAPGTNNFTGTDNVRDHAQEVTVKLDQQISPWWTVNGSYIFYEALQPLGNPLHTLPGSYSYTYHRQVDAIQANAAVKEIGANVTAVQGDVSKLDDLDRLFAQIKREKGKLDVVFANAGGGEFVPLGSYTEEHFDKTFNINVKGLVFTVQKALPLLPDGATIVLNGSIVSVRGFENFGVYNATKAAVRSFARTWTNELKSRKIRVNVVSPWPIDTPAISGLVGNDSEQEKQLKAGLVAGVPLGRIGEPDELAKVVVFLASDDSSFVAGIELFVDGGFVAV